MELTHKIEAILLWKNEPVQVAELAKILDTSHEEITENLEQLSSDLAERGVRVVINGNEATLATAPEMGTLIEQLTKEELCRDLGKAGLETLAIITYKGPVSRAEIEYIRGVNSTFSLRHLLMRGLIERLPSPHDARSFLYQPTLNLLQCLGVSHLSELPEYETMRQQIEKVSPEPEVTEPNHAL